MSWVLHMQPSAAPSPNGGGIPQDTLAFYRDVLQVLNNASLPYLIGGAYALNHYAGVTRHTKDFDIFIARADYERISKTLSDAGYHTDLTYPHWLGKVSWNGDTIDLVFSSGNGVAEVDKDWFDHAVPADIFGIQVKICPAEETIWSKAFIMERERFDGADIAHLILARGQLLDWPRLKRRFDPHWRLLLSHLILFGFIYPDHRAEVPIWIMNELINCLAEELQAPSPSSKICGGTLLSREQYLNDVHQWGYQDARVVPHGTMTKQDTAKWTDAIKNKND